MTFSVVFLQKSKFWHFVFILEVKKLTEKMFESKGNSMTII